ncbi:MAG: DUF1499 domain-containing protein [Leptolyngbyaceae cyanobacterium bins.59]|nr:DUF1499 domain-containing protein [Leptolyngbyaceae cyanobacterium bins.59]
MAQSQPQPRSKFGWFLFLPLILFLALGIGVSGIFSGGVSILAGQRPANLGIEVGKFAPCPATPNCVSSQSQDSAHAIAPLPRVDEPIVALKEIVESFPKAKVIAATDTYLYAEFASALMGFVDDVEFAVEPSAIQVRSASRLGESDLGVNQNRIEKIRSLLQERMGGFEKG